MDPPGLQDLCLMLLIGQADVGLGGLSEGGCGIVPVAPDQFGEPETAQPSWTRRLVRRVRFGRPLT